MMTKNSYPALLFRSGDHTCALGISHIVEVMRPQPVRQLDQAPKWVCGLSVIRGIPVPVVGLAALLGGVTSLPRRLVVVRTGERQIAIAVDAVLGIRNVDGSILNALPPLMQNTAGEAIEQIAALDGELLLVLKSANLVPESIWQTLVRQET